MRTVLAVALIATLTGCVKEKPNYAIAAGADGLVVRINTQTGEGSVLKQGKLNLYWEKIPE